MKRNGFTLIELLVVMAIIAILASIVVPNVISYIRDARATRAHTEIQNINLALTKMLTDADRNSVNDLFNREAVENALSAYSGMDQVVAASQLYTNVLYTLLRSGRQALQDEYGAYLDSNVVKKLGLAYMDVGFDPWGGLYQFFPGPWTSSPWFRAGSPPVFRVYARDDNQDDLPGNLGGAKADAFTVDVLDPVTEAQINAGFSAPLQHTCYIWSKGENTISDQAFAGVTGATGTACYPQQPDPQFYGGGDDINNWDNGRSWERLYN